MTEIEDVFEEFYGSEEAQAHYAERSRERDEVIADDLRPLIEEFLSGDIGVEEFKTRVDGINTSNNLWGFSGFNGQMHFNQMYNAAPDEAEFAAALRDAIDVPATVDEARTKIEEMADLARAYRDNPQESRPRIKPTMFFLSYFWHIQAPNEYPVFYPASETLLEELGILEERSDYGAYYVEFVQTVRELRETAEEMAEEPQDLRDVSAALYWYQNREEEQQAEATAAVAEERSTGIDGDPYLPPIVADLSEVAAGTEQARSRYDADDSSLPVIFEDKIGHAFRMLGFETTELGQGAGREPDGIAAAVRSNYAVIYDAKVRQDGYSFGRDDRAIREYIETHTRQLRDQGTRNIYFVIVSSEFPDPEDHTIQDLITSTDIDNIVLLKADLLLDMLKIRLNEPYVSLEDIETVFSSPSGERHQEELQHIIPDWRDTTLDDVL